MEKVINCVWVCVSKSIEIVFIYSFVCMMRLIDVKRFLSSWMHVVNVFRWIAVVRCTCTLYTPKNWDRFTFLFICSIHFTGIVIRLTDHVETPHIWTRVQSILHAKARQGKNRFQHIRIRHTAQSLFCGGCFVWNGNRRCSMSDRNSQIFIPLPRMNAIYRSLRVTAVVTQSFRPKTSEVEKH